jgi:hypothetical protein
MPAACCQKAFRRDELFGDMIAVRKEVLRMFVEVEEEEEEAAMGSEGSK